MSFTPNSSISRWFHPDLALRWVVKIFRRMEDWHGGLSLDVCRKEARKSHGVASGKHVDVFFSAVFFESHFFRELWLFLGVQLMEIKQLVFKVEMIFLESANMLLVFFFFFFSDFSPSWNHPQPAQESQESSYTCFFPTFKTYPGSNAYGMMNLFFVPVYSILKPSIASKMFAQRISALLLFLNECLPMVIYPPWN